VLYSTLVRVRRSALAALFGAVACYGVLAMTEPPGPGLDPDSMSYLGAAESLVRQGTLRIPAAHWADADSTSPLGHFPPGFSLAIAAPLALGAPPEQAARAVLALAGFATLALAVWLVATVSGLAAGAVAGVLLLVTSALALDHVRVLSEPLCLSFLAATLTLMVCSKRPLVYGTAAAAAGIVRYAAVSATGAAVLWALGCDGSLRERVRRAVLAAAPGIVLQALWVLRTEAESGSVRSFGLRSDLGPTLRELGVTLGAWLAPSVPGWFARSLIGLAVGVGVAVLLLTARRADARFTARTRPSPLARLFSAAGLLAACYAAMVLFSRLFVDEGIPFDDRLLSPLFLLAEIAVAAALGVRWRVWSRRARAGGALVGALWLGASAWATAHAIRDANEGGWGYSSDEWRGSGLGRWLRTEGRNTQIYSNNPAAAYFLTHRPSRDLPSTLDPESVHAFGSVLHERGGVVVRFPYDFEPVAAPDSIAARLGLVRLAGFPDGVVWGPAIAARDSLSAQAKRD
jgi:hypothetical protein